MTRKGAPALLAVVLGLACMALRAFVIAAERPAGLATAAVLLAAGLLALPFLPFARSWAVLPAGSPEDGGGRPLRLLAAVLSCAAGLLWTTQVLADTWDLIQLLMGLILLLQGVALAALTLMRSAGPPVYTGLLLFPPFAACFWLVAFYHAYGAAPGAETYLWPLAAGLMACAAWLQYAGAAFQAEPSPLPGLSWLLALLLIPVSLTAPLTPALRLSLAAQLAWFLPAAWQLQVQPARHGRREAPLPTDKSS